MEVEKVLFIPQDSREIAQIVLIRDELIRLDIDISSIALNKTLAQYLLESNLEYKKIEDYHTQNTVKIIRHEQPSLIYINPISISPFTIAFINAATYLGIQCLHIYYGNIASFNTRGLTSLPEKVAVLSGRVLDFCRSLNNFLSIIYLVKTIETTSNYVGYHNILFRELLKMKNPYVESHRYRKGANLIVPSHSTKEIIVTLGWPEESVFIQDELKLDVILRQLLNRS